MTTRDVSSFVWRRQIHVKISPQEFVLGLHSVNCASFVQTNWR